MPCSDSEAREYLSDHRTQRLMGEQKELKNTISFLQTELEDLKSANEKDMRDQWSTLRNSNIEFANKINTLTELLCNATYVLFEKGVLNQYPPLQKWFEDHTEEDVKRMEEELFQIRKHKDSTLQSIIKWYETLDAKERWIFETHKNFKGIKLN
tara:strand:+ start:849 stop:1310 length:462 start_codon:yes stop_codon:yes gene_type:complete